MAKPERREYCRTRAHLRKTAFQSRRVVPCARNDFAHACATPSRRYFPWLRYSALTPRRVSGADEFGVYHERVSESQSPHDAASCFAVESKKIFRARSDGIFRLRGHTTCARKIPPKIGPLEKKPPSRPGKDSIRRRRLGDGLSGDCLPLKQEQSRPLTWQTNRRQVFCLSQNCERQNCENRRTQVGRCRFESAENNLGLCARARRPGHHTAWHARQAETHESNRQRAHVRSASRRRLAKAGPGPAASGRDTRSSDGPTLRVFLNHEQETGRGRSPRR